MRRFRWWVIKEIKKIVVGGMGEEKGDYSWYNVHGKFLFRPGKWLTTLTGDCIGLRDLVAYYIGNTFNLSFKLSCTVECRNNLLSTLWEGCGIRIRIDSHSMSLLDPGGKN